MEGLLWLVLIGLLLSLLEAEQRKERVKKAYRFNPANAHGGARFATTVKDLKALLTGKGIPVGYARIGRRLRALHYEGLGHVLTVAAARTGKGASLLINALLSWRHSCIVICPKCENTSVTAHYRRRFGKVYVVNPYGMFLDALKGLKQARFNPMAALDPKLRGFHADCDKLAAALVWDEGHSDRHWPTAARLLVSGVIAALVRHGKPEERNLAAVARYISGDIFTFCRNAMQSNDADIIQKLARFAAQGAEASREIQDVIATAITQLGFITGAIADSLSGSDFCFSELKRKPGTTIYICIPLNKLDGSGDKYFRLIVETAIARLLDETQRGKHPPVLLIIDEFAQLGGNIKSIENAAGMAAGAAKLQLWFVLQDLTQLVGMFPKTWETFIQNCGITMWFGARDQTTREYISKLSGLCEVITRSRSVSVDRMGEPHVNDSASQVARPLVHPFEAGQLAADEMFLFAEGVSCGPVKAKRKFYFECPEYAGKYRPNPYFKKHGGGLVGWLFR
jgi:type IV secretion system protein VirD4